MKKNMKKYEVVTFSCSDRDMSHDLGVGTRHYLGISKEKADAAFKCICKVAESKTRHISGLKLNPIAVTEYEVDEDDYDDENEIQFKMFKDHYYGDRASDEDEDDKEEN